MKTPKHRLIAVRVLLVLVPLVTFIVVTDRLPGKDRLPWQSSVGFLGWLAACAVFVVAGCALLGSAIAFVNGWIDGGTWREAKASLWRLWHGVEED